MWKAGDVAVDVDLYHNNYKQLLASLEAARRRLSGNTSRVQYSITVRSNKVRILKALTHSPVAHLCFDVCCDTV